MRIAMVDGNKEDQFKKGAESTPSSEDLVSLSIRVPQNLYRAYQRGCWIVSQETGRSREELAQEMVTDFLVKYGC